MGQETAVSGNLHAPNFLVVTEDLLICRQRADATRAIIRTQCGVVPRRVHRHPAVATRPATVWISHTGGASGLTGNQHLELGRQPVVDGQYDESFDCGSVLLCRQESYCHGEVQGEAFGATAGGPHPAKLARKSAVRYRVLQLRCTGDVHVECQIANYSSAASFRGATR